MWIWTHFTCSIIVFCKTLLTLPHCRNKTRTHFHLFRLSICCLKETRADECFSAAALEPKLCHCVMCYGVTNHSQVSPNGWDLALVQSRVLSQSGSLWSGAQHLSVWKASVGVTVDVNVLRLVMLSPIRQGCVGTCVSWARVNSFPLYVNAETTWSSRDISSPSQQFFRMQTFAQWLQSAASFLSCFIIPSFFLGHGFLLLMCIVERRGNTGLN